MTREADYGMMRALRWLRLRLGSLPLCAPCVGQTGPQLLAATLFVGLSGPALAANTLTITDKSGAALGAYPLQIGRAFLAGEIANYPQLLVGGAPVPTQADVKQRHADGSVRFAVIAATLAVPANGTIAVSFANQTSGNNTPLTQAQMLDPRFMDASISIDGTVVSARTMLTAGNCKPWTQGQIAQTMVCADDSLAHAYDVGPIRPRFHVTFWNGTGKAAVRWIGENGLAGAMIDKQYDLAFSLGATQVSKPALIHPFGSRWTRTSEAAAAVNIDHNLPYLASTHFVPNLDPSTPVSEAAIASDYAAWQTAPKDLYQSGLWTKAMPTTGGRADLGLMPDWHAKWLYTGDWRAREIVLGQADLAAAWVLNFREGRAGKKIDKAQTVDGVGLPLSVYAEPSVWLPTNNGNYGQGITLADHTIVTDPAGYPKTAWGWEADGAHLPMPFYLPYVLTGDPFYLEQSQLWSAALAFSVPGLPWTSRGPGAGIEKETRGNAWMLADRVNTLFITPDDQGTLRRFAGDMLDDSVALFEGKAGITGTAFTNGPMWLHGKANTQLGADPLHFDQFQGSPAQSSQWMHAYLINALGWATERGMPTRAYRDWIGRMLTGQFAEAGYNRFNVASYWIAVKDAAGVWYPNWTTLQTDNIAQGRMVSGSFNLGNYGYWALAGASFLTGLPDGQATYDWLRANLVIDRVAAGLQWNLLPAGTAPLPPDPPVPPDPPPPGVIVVGSNVITSAVTNVRKTQKGKVLCIQPPGAVGKVAAGPAGSPPSWKVDFASLCDGYVPAASLTLVP